MRFPIANGWQTIVTVMNIEFVHSEYHSPSHTIIGETSVNILHEPFAIEHPDVMRWYIANDGSLVCVGNAMRAIRTCAAVGLSAAAARINCRREISIRDSSEWMSDTHATDSCSWSFCPYATLAHLSPRRSGPWLHINHNFAQKQNWRNDVH